MSTFLLHSLTCVVRLSADCVCVCLCLYVCACECILLAALLDPVCFWAPILSAMPKLRFSVKLNLAVCGFESADAARIFTFLHHLSVEVIKFFLYFFIFAQLFLYEFIQKTKQGVN